MPKLFPERSATDMNDSTLPLQVLIVDAEPFLREELEEFPTLSGLTLSAAVQCDPAEQAVASRRADKRSVIRQRKPLSAQAVPDRAGCRDVSLPLRRFLQLVADPEESAGCAGG